MARDRLTVAVPPALRHGRRDNGHQHVWARVLERLARWCDVVDAGRPRRLRRRPDVWLYDGHSPPPPAPGPVQVVQLHEPVGLDHEPARFMAPEFLSRLREHTAAAVAVAAAILTGSEASRRGIIAEHGADPDRVVAVPHGVDHSVFNLGAAGHSAAVLARAGGDPSRPYVVFVSQLHPRKGVDHVRGAVTQLAREGFPHQLVLVGGPPVDRPDAAEVAASYRAPLDGVDNSVVAIQGVAERDLAALLAGAAAFCLPSYMEGFGLTALEALACGVPAVVSDRGALPEVVGDAAVVVPPDTGAVTDALRSVLTDTDLAAALRRRAVDRAASFDWDRTARGWLAVLQQAAEGSFVR